MLERFRRNLNKSRSKSRSSKSSDNENNKSNITKSPKTPKKTTKEEKNIQTPESLKKQLEKLNGDNLDSINKSINKKLTVLTTEFIPEYDTLLVSSTNNKISC